MAPRYIPTAEWNSSEPSPSQPQLLDVAHRARLPGSHIAAIIGSTIAIACLLFAAVVLYFFVFRRPPREEGAKAPSPVPLDGITVHRSSSTKLEKPSILLHRSKTAPSLRTTTRSRPINPRFHTSWRPSVHELPPIPAVPAASSPRVARPSLRPSLRSSSSRKRSSLFSIGEEEPETHPVSRSSPQQRTGEGDRVDAENRSTPSQTLIETHIRPGVLQSPESESEPLETVSPGQGPGSQSISAFPIQANSWSTDLAAAASLADAYISTYTAPVLRQDLNHTFGDRRSVTDHDTPPAVTPRPVISMRPVSWDAPRSVVEVGDEGWDGSEYSPTNGRSRQGSCVGVDPVMIVDERYGPDGLNEGLVARGSPGGFD